MAISPFAAADSDSFGRVDNRQGRAHFAPLHATREAGGNGLSGRGRRCDGQCRTRDPQHPCRTPISARRTGGGRLGALDRGHHRLRRQRRGAQGQEPRTFRLFRLGHRLVRRGVRGLEDLCAKGGRGRLHGDRQQLAVPDGPGRSADRAGGECRGARRLSQEEYHRQSELLDGAAGGRTEAAS